jgi:hypothetical protein
VTDREKLIELAEKAMLDAGRNPEPAVLRVCPDAHLRRLIEYWSVDGVPDDLTPE